MGMRQSKRATQAKSPAPAAAPSPRAPPTPTAALPAPMMPVAAKAPVAAPAPASASRAAIATDVTVGPLPHYHTAFCDRKREVCTADGAIREGNRLQATLRNTGATPRPRITWYRSKQEYSKGASPPCAVTDPSFATYFEAIRRPEREDLVFALPSVHGVQIAPADDPVRYHATMAERITSGRSEEAAAPDQDSPLFTTAAAWKFLHAEAIVAHRDAWQYVLGKADVGRFLTAVVVKDTAGPAETLSTNIVGPVEAAPPRMRELWIDGPARSGSQLIARCIYFGGRSGDCEFTWMRVDTEGNRSEVAAGRINADEPLRETSDPRRYALSDADVGCIFKVCCEPVRADGARGAPSTSKPTAEITRRA